MGLLTRKLSIRSLADRGRDEGPSTVVAERAQSESKPSLLRRLTRSSRPKDRECSQEPDPPAITADEVQNGHIQQAPNANIKQPPPKVNDIHPVESGRLPESTSPQAQPLPHHAESTDNSQIPGGHATAIQTHVHSASHHHSHHEKEGLTKEDVEHLFSGAPQFVLEKGRRGRYFPQVFFPWNNDLEISDLQDRRYLKHESFALATLHAHLPIPDEVNWKPGLSPPVKQEGLELGKRPMFELGIFERPNMLSLDGREPGTVGFRYFLERPVSDGMLDEKVKEHGKDVENDLAIANAPAMEAFKMLALSRENDELNAKIGKHAAVVERARLIDEGPHSWKAVGVRDISMETLAERMETISQLRDQVINLGWQDTVLNHLNTEELYTHLFNTLLYPPRKIHSEVKQDKASLKIQIEALVKVLTTPGAWVDLSAPEARLRFGKILHSKSSRFDPATGLLVIDPERKWLLVQLMLSVELVIRLDAALRLGIALHVEGFEVSTEEIHHFNKLRNLKVDWDLVVARRFLFLSYLKKIERKASAPVSTPAPSERYPNSRQISSASHEQRRSSLFGGLRHAIGRNSATDIADTRILDECDLAVMPRQPWIMVDGLSRFATAMGWPRSDHLEQVLHQKLCTANADDRERLLMDAMTCSREQVPEHKPDKLTGSLQAFNVDLQAATSNTIGGWLSHSWLSGLILPGTSICDIIMSALLENDPDPQTLRDLGSSKLPLRGAGFILNGSSWWSKSSILGRVMAPMRGARESMGWVYVPNLVPLYENTSQPMSNCWIKLKTFPIPTDRERPRIFDGDKLAADSSPLGQGRGGIMGKEFSMVTDHIFDGHQISEVVVTDIKIHLSASNLTDSSREHPLSAWAQFNLSLSQATSPDYPVSASVTREVRYGLNRAVYFVTAYPCRLPHGHVTFKPASLDFEHEQQHPVHKPGVAEHIPAHPLHKTYKFEVKSLADLVQNPQLTPPNPTNHNEPVWIIDARGHSTGANTQHLSPGSSPTSPKQTATGPAQNVGMAITTPVVNNFQHDAATMERYLHGSSDPQMWEKDILVRAWCAEKGRNAIIARSGRTCLSCAIREARALEIGVIVRVGIRE